MREFSEASFDLEKSYEYILSIQVSLNGFSFSIVRPSDKVLLFFKTIPLKISSNALFLRRFKEWIASEELVQKPFKKVRLIIFSDKFSFVPAQLQHKDLNEDLVHLLFQSADTYQFAENLVKILSAKLLFAIPDGLIHAVQELVGECEIIHPLKLIINSTLKTTDDQSLVLLFDENNLQLIVVQNKELLLANSFRINHANDVVYFILTALKQLNVASRKTKLFYSGQSTYLIDSVTNLEKHFSTSENLSAGKLKITNDLPDKMLSENISLFL